MSLSAEDLHLPPYSPHLTLGRWSDVYVKKMEGTLVRNSLNLVEDIVRWEAPAMHLMDSTLEPEGQFPSSSEASSSFFSVGPTYTLVHSSSFTGGRVPRPKKSNS